MAAFAWRSLHKRICFASKEILIFAMKPLMLKTLIGKRTKNLRTDGPSSAFAKLEFPRLQVLASVETLYSF